MSTTRVLIADDHAVVRDGIAHTLHDLPGVEIVGEVGDGSTLFEAMARLQPDCLLLDIGMPDFAPLNAVKQIRERYPDLKILVVSAYDDDAYVHGMLSAGVQGYHLKDQPLSDLKLAVQRVLAGERWVCSPLIEKLLHPHEAPGSTGQLTCRQEELLRCLQEGLDNQSIAHKTGLSVKTVENQLTLLYRQIQVQSRLEAVNYLSQHPELLAASESASMPDTPRPHLAILVVDDNLRYRAQLRRMISRVFPQAQIQEAENTRAALALLENIAPQLALVDAVLGNENGIDCIRRIRERWSSMRIVLISAYPDRTYHRLGLEAGAAAFIDKKDLTAASLREIIADAIG